MSSIRIARFLVGVTVLAAILALGKYFDVKRQVEGSPYWATSPASARQLGTFIVDIEAVTAGPGLPGPEAGLLAVWFQHSYRYVRTGLFSSAIAVNKEQGVRALFDRSLVAKCLSERWRIEVDGRRAEPVLASSGTLVEGFQEGPASEHSIKVTTRSGEAVEWRLRFVNRAL